MYKAPEKRAGSWNAKSLSDVIGSELGARGLCRRIIRNAWSVILIVATLSGGVGTVFAMLEGWPWAAKLTLAASVGVIVIGGAAAYTMRAARESIADQLSALMQPTPPRPFNRREWHIEMELSRDGTWELRTTVRLESLVDNLPSVRSSMSPEAGEFTDWHLPPELVGRNVTRGREVRISRKLYQEGPTRLAWEAVFVPPLGRGEVLEYTGIVRYRMDACLAAERLSRVRRAEPGSLWVTYTLVVNSDLEVLSVRRVFPKGYPVTRWEPVVSLGGNRIPELERLLASRIEGHYLEDGRLSVSLPMENPWPRLSVGFQYLTPLAEDIPAPLRRSMGM